MPTFAEGKAELVELILENVEDNTISESDIGPILRKLAAIKTDRPLNSWKQIVQNEIESHETGHTRSNSKRGKKNNNNSCPYPAQYKHAEACSAYHKALDDNKGVRDAKKAMYRAVAAAAAGGGKTRRKARKAKYSRRR
jgi:hypothetical protein